MEYAVEPELVAATPRHVKMTTFATRLRIFVLLLVSAAVVLTPINAWNDIRAMQALGAASRPVTGVITGRNMRPAHHFDLYFLHYAYVVGGHRYADTETVSEDRYDVVPDGAAISLMYVPANPSFHYLNPITDETVQSAIADWIIRALMVVGFFALFAIANEMALRNQLHLLRDGKPARGAVVEMIASRGNWGPSVSAVTYRITCRFWTGYEEVSRQFVVPGSLYGHVTLGTPLTVVFDPRHPQNSLPYKAITDVFLDACS